MGRHHEHEHCACAEYEYFVVADNMCQNDVISPGTGCAAASTSGISLLLSNTDPRWRRRHFGSKMAKKDRRLGFEMADAKTPFWIRRDVNERHLGSKMANGRHFGTERNSLD